MASINDALDLKNMAQRIIQGNGTLELSHGLRTAVQEVSAPPTPNPIQPDVLKDQRSTTPPISVLPSPYDTPAGSIHAGSSSATPDQNLMVVKEEAGLSTKHDDGHHIDTDTSSASTVNTSNDGSITPALPSTATPAFADQVAFSPIAGAPAMLPYYYQYYQALETASAEVAAQYPGFGTDGQWTPEVIQAYAEAAATAVAGLGLAPSQELLNGFANRLDLASLMPPPSGTAQLNHQPQHQQQNVVATDLPRSSVPLLAPYAYHASPYGYSYANGINSQNSINGNSSGDVKPTVDSMGNLMRRGSIASSLNMTDDYDEESGTMSSSSANVGAAQFRKRRRHRGTRFTMQPRKVKRQPHISITQADVAITDMVEFLPDGKLPCPWHGCGEFFVRKYNLRVHYASHLRAQRRKQIEAAGGDAGGGSSSAGVSGGIESDTQMEEYEYEEEPTPPPQLPQPAIRRGRGRPRGSFSRRIYSYRVPADDDEPAPSDHSQYANHSQYEHIKQEQQHQQQQQNEYISQHEDQDVTEDEQDSKPFNVPFGDRNVYNSNDFRQVPVDEEATDDEEQEEEQHVSQGISQQQLQHEQQHFHIKQEPPITPHNREPISMKEVSSKRSNNSSGKSIDRNGAGMKRTPTTVRGISGALLPNPSSDDTPSSSSLFGSRPRRSGGKTLWSQDSEDVGGYSHRSLSDVGSYDDEDDDNDEEADAQSDGSEDSNASSFSANGSMHRRKRRATTANSNNSASRPSSSLKGASSPSWIDFPANENASEIVSQVNPDHNGRYPCPHPGCERAFGRRFNLRTHYSATHIGERKFGCPKCTRRFARRADLARHSRLMHS
ncbi:hypothetical protein SmJEL517_g01138 [Synchytrium microbalum]|uniref:C2H2-type domain-containing protein n=1 Tax=Synchytrium microbalum TaxID=1806994 RepID=A0A507CAZ0_9FUNG|nr:uncharacterized protein SmJEL517_g01138 [Synchytrium microbalum]TPX36631.1 hypothetical protein SmJEL517_g01138 [Synchytrium microbalum]